MIQAMLYGACWGGFIGLLVILVASILWGRGKKEL